MGYGFASLSDPVSIVMEDRSACWRWTLWSDVQSEARSRVIIPTQTAPAIYCIFPRQHAY